MKTTLVFNNGTLNHITPLGKVVASINLHNLTLKQIQQHYPKYYQEYLLLLEENF